MFGFYVIAVFQLSENYNKTFNTHTYEAVSYVFCPFLQIFKFFKENFLTKMKVL